MPVTPDQAISAAMRGVMRSLEDAPPDGSVEQFNDFLRHSYDAVNMTRHQLLATITTRGDGNEEATKAQTTHSYLRALGLAITGLLTLAHHPYLAEIDEALPGEKLT